MRLLEKLSLGLMALCASGPAVAQETVTYSYDALGRLTAVSNAGGPNGGTSVATSFDPAGNRTNYSVSVPQSLLSRDDRVPTVSEASGQTAAASNSGLTDHQ